MKAHLASVFLATALNSTDALSATQDWLESRVLLKDVKENTAEILYCSTSSAVTVPVTTKYRENAILETLKVVPDLFESNGKASCTTFVSHEDQYWEINCTTKSKKIAVNWFIEVPQDKTASVSLTEYTLKKKKLTGAVKMHRTMCEWESKWVKGLHVISVDPGTEKTDKLYYQFLNMESVDALKKSFQSKEAQPLKKKNF